MQKVLSSSRTGESTWRATFRLASREPSAHLRTQLPTRYPQHQKVQRARSTKNPLAERAYPERLMGLEPTTFCMAKQWLNGGLRRLCGSRVNMMPADYRRLPWVRVTNG